MLIFSQVTEKRAFKTGTSHMTAKIRIVQDCAAVLAIAEFLFDFVWHNM